MSYTMAIINVGAPVPVEAYSAKGFYLHRWPARPGTWQVRRGLSNVLMRDVNWCEAKDEFWRNTGIDLGNAWGNCAQAEQQTTTAQVITADPALSFGLKGLAIGAIALLSVATLGLAGLAFVVAMPFAAALMLTWKYRYQIDSFLYDLVCSPFVLLSHGAQVIKATQRHAAPAKGHGILMLSGPTAITDPRRLLALQSIDVLELPTQKQPVKVRKPRKAVTHGHTA